MRRTIVRIGATGAGALLALGLLAAPPAGATGSGREGKGERSGKVACFNGEGRTQGRSLSDPDGDSNGGADKPGCGGGFDADKDANNGCGNDADREDDNNGNCGRHKPARVKAEKVDADIKLRCQHHDRETTTTTSSTDVAGAAASANGCKCPKDEDSAVLGASDVKLQAASVPPAEASTTTTTTTAPTTVLGSSVTAPAAPETQVLGETLSQPDTLARTGAGIGGLALLGGLLLGGGRLTVLARKLLRIG